MIYFTFNSSSRRYSMIFLYSSILKLIVHPNDSNGSTTDHDVPYFQRARTRNPHWMHFLLNDSVSQVGNLFLHPESWKMHFLFLLCQLHWKSQGRSQEFFPFKAQEVNDDDDDDNDDYHFVWHVCRAQIKHIKTNSTTCALTKNFTQQ